MPSRYEAWPLTALEAGASGVPVVGSDIVGVRDAAPPFPRGHGVLVPQGDVPALAEAMLKLLHEPELRFRIGAAGREWAARFTWDALAQAQLAFYEELVMAPRSENRERLEPHLVKRS
jgi:glycosyltransferase involved in cell wall biosynthesis